MLFFNKLFTSFFKIPALIILLQILQTILKFCLLHLFIYSFKVDSETIFYVSNQDNFLKYIVWFLIMVFIKIIYLKCL